METLPENCFLKRFVVIHLKHIFKTYTINDILKPIS